MSDFGIILINKPVGITSFDVVKRIRKITKIKKIGHTGTLDPFASGLLPICIGKATRLAEKLSAKNKEYLVTMKLGIRTDTGDITGKIVEELELPEIKLETIKKIIPDILNISKQIPHKFSAVKVNGKRAYELARANREFKLETRPIKIHSFEIVNFSLPEITYRTEVSKGTYIRSLSETIAEKLGIIATSITLCRTKIGELKNQDAVELEKLTEENWKISLRSLPEILTDFQKYYLNSEEIVDFKNGRQFKVDFEDTDEIMILDMNEKCVGFAGIEQSIIKPRIVLI